MTSNERHNSMYADSIEVGNSEQDVKVGFNNLLSSPGKEFTGSVAFECLPPFPPSDSQEFEELTRISSQPEHCHEND